MLTMYKKAECETDIIPCSSSSPATTTDTSRSLNKLRDVSPREIDSIASSTLVSNGDAKTGKGLTSGPNWSKFARGVRELLRKPALD
jgi:hypothetical protein